MSLRRARHALALLALGACLLVLPDSVDRPARLSLVKIESAEAADFVDGTVWVLALGSDARPPDEILEGNADAIELIGLNFETGAAIAIAVMRDSWVDIPGEGMSKINAGLHDGGPELMAQLVEELVGIQPQYVVTAGFDAFASVVDEVGVLRVRSDVEFVDPASGYSFTRGRNELDGAEATAFARSRAEFNSADFQRVANQQQLLHAILRRVLANVKIEGSIEDAALAVLHQLDTRGLSPVELYRFAYAITQLELEKVTLCVLGGSPKKVDDQDVLIVDPRRAKRVGSEARDDATLETGC